MKIYNEGGAKGLPSLFTENVRHELSLFILLCIFSIIQIIATLAYFTAPKKKSKEPTQTRKKK